MVSYSKSSLGLPISTSFNILSSIICLDLQQIQLTMAEFALKLTFVKKS